MRCLVLLFAAAISPHCLAAASKPPPSPSTSGIGRVHPIASTHSRSQSASGHGHAKREPTRMHPPPPLPFPPPQNALAACWECTVSVAFFAASLVQGIAGFGIGIVAMAIVPTALPLMDASPIVAVFCLCVTASLTVQLRASVHNPIMRAVLPSILMGCVVGVPLGGVLLARADPDWLRLILGSSMLLFVGERMLHGGGSTAAGRRAYTAVAHDSALLNSREYEGADGAETHRLKKDEIHSLQKDDTAPVGEVRSRAIDHPLVGFAVGLMSGILGGALNEAGPPVVIFLAMKGGPKDAIKATLQVYFTLVSIAVVCMMGTRGLLLPRHLYYDAVGAPAAVFGLGLGVCLYNRIDQVLFARLLVGAMLITGLAYVGSSAARLVHADADMATLVSWVVQMHASAVQQEQVLRT